MCEVMATAPAAARKMSQQSTAPSYCRPAQDIRNVHGRKTSKHTRNTKTPRNKPTDPTHKSTTEKNTTLQENMRNMRIYNACKTHPNTHLILNPKAIPNLILTLSSILAPTSITWTPNLKPNRHAKHDPLGKGWEIDDKSDYDMVTATATASLGADTSWLHWCPSYIAGGPTVC